jgi:hypothetical protein
MVWIRGDRWRIVSIFLCQLLLLQPVFAQQGALRINIIEGSGSKNVIQQISPRPLIVRVEDSNGGSISGAVVQFSAPTVGPSGRFENDSVVYQTVTSDEGLAVAPGFLPNSVTGTYRIQVRAEYQGRMAANFIEQENVLEGKSRKKLIAILAVGGAAVAAAIVAGGGNGGSGSTTTPPNITFGGSAVGAPNP